MEVPTSSCFRKTDACPSSDTLLLLRSHSLSPEVSKLVRYHLAECDFCSAEISLLAHYSVPTKKETKPPDIPINLRILAESLFFQTKQTLLGRAAGPKHGLAIGDA